MKFERFIAIDWSGAGPDTQRNRGLAIADDHGIVSPPRFTTWTRLEVEDFLKSAFAGPPAVIAIDAALSFAYGFQHAVFEVETWVEMVESFGVLSERHDTAREIARSINARFDGGGPFRFDECRNDTSFYREHDVAYFRAVGLRMPQCVSPFYLGSGACVGFHSITCLSMLSRLMRLRETSEIDFQVWPFEGESLRSNHVILECYPALYPIDGIDSDDIDGHQRDALRTVEWLKNTREELDWSCPPVPFGRRVDVPWNEQLAFEGWVLGV